MVYIRSQGRTSILRVVQAACGAKENPNPVKTEKVMHQRAHRRSGERRQAFCSRLEEQPR